METKFPKRLHRFLAQREHAEQFVRGKILVSTVEHIRNADDMRADPMEGTSIWSHEPVLPDTHEEERKKILAQLEDSRFIKLLGPGSVVYDNKYVVSVPDGFILCTTSNKKLSTFGSFRLDISNPEVLFKRLCVAISREYEFQHPPAFFPIRYDIPRDSREYNKIHPITLGANNNNWEEEYRMLWTVKNCPLIQPRIFDVGDISGFARLTAV